MFTNVAHGANIGSLVNSINKVILNPFIVLIFAVALVVFIYGVVRYLLNPENESIRTESKSHMIWGVIGMFIMISVFGIMRIILNSVGEKNIKIQDTGEVNIDKWKIK